MGWIREVALFFGRFFIATLVFYVFSGGSVIKPIIYGLLFTGLYVLIQGTYTKGGNGWVARFMEMGAKKR